MSDGRWTPTWGGCSVDGPREERPPRRGPKRASNGKLGRPSGESVHAPDVLSRSDTCQRTHPSTGDMAAGDLRTYLEALYGLSLVDGDLAPDVEVEIRSFRPAPRKGALHPYRSGATLAAVEAVVGADHKAGADVYNGVHLRRRGAERGGDVNVEVLTAVIADVDVDKAGVTYEAAFAALAASPIGPPTIVVSSGGGQHAYWVYDERTEATDANHAQHRRLCAYVRECINVALKAEAADDMSSRDRILRPPGTSNMKPARRDADGRPPPVTLLFADGPRLSMVAALAVIPPGFNPDRAAAPARSRDKARAVDKSALPTQIPERLRRVLAQTGCGLKPMGVPIEAIKVSPCPACHGTDGGCYVHPVSGALRSFRERRCPAHGAGIPLEEWVARYVPRALRALSEPPRNDDVGDRLAAALAEFSAYIEGLPAESSQAQIGVTLSDAVWVDEVSAHHTPTRGRGALARRIARVAEGVLQPLRDAEGRIRQAIGLGGDLLPSRVAPSRGDDAVAGGVLTLGSLPAAAARAADETLYLTIGPIDYLAALGWLAARADGGVVLGLVGHERDVLGQLVDRWVRAGVRPSRVVVFAHNATDPAAFSRLDGVAGTTWVDSPSTLDGSLARPGGLAAITRKVGAGGWLFRPPAPIHDIGPRIVQDLRQAVMLAANSTASTLVIYSPPPGTGKSTFAQQIAAEIADGRFTVPVRGRRPPGFPPESWPPLERAVAFATPTHALADEKIAGHDAMGLIARAQRHKGALHYCQFADHVDAAYPHVGRRGICGDVGSQERCELANECQGARTPKAARGEVGYITDAMAPHVAFDFIISDESTGVVNVTAAVAADVGSLCAGKLLPRVRRWRTQQNPAAADAAQALRRAFEPLAAQHGADVGAGRVPPFPRRISGEELCRLLDAVPNLIGWLDDGFSNDAVHPPVPRPPELRSGVHAGHHMPSLQAFKVLKALRAYYRRVRHLSDDGATIPLMLRPVESPPPIVILQLNEDGTWALEHRAVKERGSAPSLVLDATGELTLPEWTAAYPQFKIHQWGMAVWGAAPRRAIHVASKGLARGRLFAPDGRLRPRTHGVTRRLIMRLVEETRRAYPRGVIGRNIEIGVLTYKAIHDALLDEWPLRAELAAAGVDLQVGYFGRDDRGTNRFEAVDGLAVIGDARPNLGDVEADCLLLRLDPETVMEARAAAVVVQAVFRARHTRRGAGSEPVLLLAAASAPEIPGLAWDVEGMGSGRAGDTLLQDMLAWVAAEWGVVGRPPLELYPWEDSGFDVENPLAQFSQRALERASESWVRAAGGWRKYQTVHPSGRGRHGTIWARSSVCAVKWGLEVGACPAILDPASRRNLYDFAAAECEVLAPVEKDQ